MLRMLSIRPKNSRKKGAPATKMETQKAAIRIMSSRTAGRPLQMRLVIIFLASTSMAPLSRMKMHRAPQKMIWKVVVEPIHPASSSAGV